MAEATKIQWCDHSASPWHGCSKVHAGCDHCYAEALSHRNPGTLGIWGDAGRRVKSKSFISALKRFNQLGEETQRVQSVFPSLCDPFEDRPELEPWRREMFETVDRLPWVRLLLLTKRPENIRRMWPYVPHTALQDEEHKFSGHRHNVRIGTSVSDQATADRMITELLKCYDLSPVLFVSAEPLLAPITFRWAKWQPLSRDRSTHELDGLRMLDWIIIGGESGPHARPCDMQWIRDLVKEADTANVPCFVKQVGANAIGDGTRFVTTDRKGGDPSEWPESLRVRQMPDVTPVSLSDVSRE